MKKFKEFYNFPYADLNSRPGANLNASKKHEIKVGNYTTKFFFMCGSAQKVMSANSDKEGAEELTKMQDELYKIVDPNGSGILDFKEINLFVLFLPLIISDE